jgi:hypothetical protein
VGFINHTNNVDAASIKEPVSEWNCHKCTSANEKDHLVCSVCLSEKDSSKKDSSKNSKKDSSKKGKKPHVLYANHFTFTSNHGSHERPLWTNYNDFQLSLNLSRSEVDRRLSQAVLLIYLKDTSYIAEDTE